jgi:hypothetical protein
VQPPDLYDLHAEGLEPGEQSVQGSLILNGAVNDRLDRLDRGGEPAEIKQGLGREDTRYPDFVVRQWHRRPLATRNHTDKLLALRVTAKCAPLVAGEFGPLSLVFYPSRAGPGSDQLKLAGPPDRLAAVRRR